MNTAYEIIANKCGTDSGTEGCRQYWPKTYLKIKKFETAVNGY